MKTRTNAFYDLLTEAIDDFVDNGFDAQWRLDYWMQRIRLAAEQELIPERELQENLRRTFTSIYERMVERGSVLGQHRGIGRFTLQQVKPKLREELDRRIMASANLIRLNRGEAIESTLRRFSGWATAIRPGGNEQTAERGLAKKQIRKALASLPFRERRVAIDQGHKFTSNLSSILAREGGALAGRWNQHYTNHPRKIHTDRNGEVYAIKGNWALEKGLMKAGPDGYAEDIESPGEYVFCFPGDSKIPYADGVEVAYRYWYSGELSTVVTSSGKTLRATPNHPVLTSKGWVAIGDLNVSDNIIEVSNNTVRKAPSKANKHNAVPTISEIFSTVSVFGLIKPRNGSRRDFHGDGTDGNIDIVFSARPLMFGVKTDFFERVQNLFFTNAYQTRFNSGFFQLFFSRNYTSATSVMRGFSQQFAAFFVKRCPTFIHLLRTYVSHCVVRVFCNSLSIFFGRIFIPSFAGIRTATNSNSSISKPSVYNVSQNSQFLGDRRSAFSRFIQSDDLVNVYQPSLKPTGTGPWFRRVKTRTFVARIKDSIRSVDNPRDFSEGFPFQTKLGNIVEIYREKFSGHVYTLQTVDGWFVTDGFITHNCRCSYTYLYSLRDLPDNMITRKGKEELERVRRELAV